MAGTCLWDIGVSDISDMFLTTESPAWLIIVIADLGALSGSSPYDYLLVCCCEGSGCLNAPCKEAYASIF